MYQPRDKIIATICTKSEDRVKASRCRLVPPVEVDRMPVRVRRGVKPAGRSDAIVNGYKR